jgi:hypothetical protein
MAPPLGMVRVEHPRDLVREAALAMVASYSEHLNSHCARCTAAWAALHHALAALESLQALQQGQALPIVKEPDRGAMYGGISPLDGSTILGALATYEPTARR